MEEGGTGEEGGNPGLIKPVYTSYCIMHFTHIFHFIITLHVSYHYPDLTTKKLNLIEVKTDF